MKILFVKIKPDAKIKKFFKEIDRKSGKRDLKMGYICFLKCPNPAKRKKVPHEIFPKR